MTLETITFKTLSFYFYIVYIHGPLLEAYKEKKSVLSVMVCGYLCAFPFNFLNFPLYHILFAQL